MLYPKNAKPNFNPRSPCGERLFTASIFRSMLEISIHAPRVGSDIRNGNIVYDTELFQSTLPVWGATCRRIPGRRNHFISIHAPRVGSDRVDSLHNVSVGHFNPRSPCGERRQRRRLCHSSFSFQSTLPVWGATRVDLMTDDPLPISIHAPRVGSD